jgi:hypothetical protein
MYESLIMSHRSLGRFLYYMTDLDLKNQGVYSQLFDTSNTTFPSWIARDLYRQLVSDLPAYDP